MRKINKKTFLSLLLLLILATGGCGSKDKVAPIVGAKAPEVTGNTVNQEKITLADFKGQVVFLTFWQTQSRPSQRELSVLNDLQRNQEENVAVITVNLGEDSIEVKKFLQDQKIMVPVIIDDPNMTLANLYRIDIIPTTFVIDRKGFIYQVLKGGLQYDQMEELVKKLS
ncbi:MAG: redoxin domain-containing protein [Clostridia bacterium]|nr:redoxin domain-containing protein [Clostridia bacterium]